MGRARDEHTEAVIRDFLDRGHAGLVRAVTAMTGDRESAHDLVQEAVIRAWERIARGEDIRSVDGWIATVALNLARTSLRRRTVRIRVERRLTDGLHVAAQLDKAELLRCLVRAARTLETTENALESPTRGHDPAAWGATLRWPPRPRRNPRRASLARRKPESGESGATPNLGKGRRAVHGVAVRPLSSTSSAPPSTQIRRVRLAQLVLPTSNLRG
jgi:RNA polymerase sigma factor (sigma-70 family)